MPFNRNFRHIYDTFNAYRVAPLDKNVMNKYSIIMTW